MKRNISPAGTLIISLDFELMWGMFDKVTSESYGAQLDGVRTAVPALLTLFTKYDIQATWAVVGMLMCHDTKEWQGVTGQITPKPKYTDIRLSSYTYGERTDTAKYASHHFAPDLVRQIGQTPGQELASHTFSHYYCLEEQAGGETVRSDSFAADTTAFATLAQQFHFTPHSIIFPRNQWSQSALTVVNQQNYQCYRGTEHHFIYKARGEAHKTNSILRALRLLDRYYNLTGHHTYSLPSMTTTTLINLPASRQLTPYSRKLRFLESLRLRRIKQSMTHAAKQGEVFHLWWHPHNFGINQAENLQFLTQLLDHYATLKKDYNFQSSTMAAAAIPDRE